MTRTSTEAMHEKRTNRIALLAVGALAMLAVGSAAMTAGASATSRGAILESSVIGRPVDAANVSIRGVPAGAVPWTVREGRATVTAAGELTLEVQGLLITGTNTSNDGTVGPVFQVVAALTCEGGTIVATSPAPLSPTGDAQIAQRVELPSTCLAPIVLVRANGAGGPWIAATGL